MPGAISVAVQCPSLFPSPPSMLPVEEDLRELPRLSEGNNQVSGGQGREGADLQESIHLGRHPEILRSWIVQAFGTVGVWELGEEESWFLA